MSVWHGIRTRLRQGLWRRESDARSSEELHFHLDMETARLVRKGLSEGDARRHARLALGSLEAHKEVLRDQRRFPFVELFWHDVRYAIRALRRDPTFALVAVSTLAVGIGAATAMFSVLHGILLRELPVRGAANVAVLWTAPASRTAEHLPVSHAELNAFAQSSRAFASVAGVLFQGAVDVVMLDGERAMPVAATWVTGQFFPLLDITPLHGRALRVSDDAPGAEPVMVISHAFWRSAFNASPDAVGRALTWNGKLHRIVGVLPAGFNYPRHVQVWMPVFPSFPRSLDTAAPAPEQMVFDVIARVRPGVGLTVARDDFTTFLRRNNSSPASAPRNRIGVLTTLVERIAGEIRAPLWAGTASVALVLLIACANVGNLLLIRGSIRAQELAIRAALGAGRARLVRQLVTEALVLAVLGGAVGIGLAYAVVHVVVAMAPSEIPQRDVIAIDAPVLLAAVAIALVSTLLCGLLPALISAHGDLGQSLRDGRSAAPGSRRAFVLRRALVIGQVALAMFVVIAAALLTRSVRALTSINMGFNSDRLAVVETWIPSSALPDHARAVALQESLIARVAAMPGVESATAMPKPPFSAQGGWMASYSGEGQSAEAQRNKAFVNFEVVGPNYFHTLQLPLLHGRAFNAQDRDGSTRVAIISAALASQTWPGADAINKRLKLGAEWHTVVGVVGETRYRDLATTQPTLYLPTRQFGGPVPMTLAVRTVSASVSLTAPLRAALRELHSEWRVVSAATMSQRMDRPLARPRFSAVLIGAFAAVALWLAAVGMYGAMAATVRERTREIGIRLALGERERGVHRLVLVEGMRLVVAGCVLGVGGALVATRLIGTLLHGVTSSDPLSYAVVSTVMLVVTAIACWVPARRASRVDPIVVLRGE